ncbi:Tat (twin-arginine translocation) pathway signal sequence domain protein [Hydrogenimonas sp.]|nr:Tat (twin-arginine translocation) pathway signal sequence domain protein [Hydrogenimonas sp.]
MNRRKFITAAGALAAWGSVRFVYSAAESMDGKEREDALELIFSVQRHLFPKGLSMPDADSFGAAQYTKEAVLHSSFDPDIRDILFDGAKRVQRLAGGTFSSLSSDKKERLLRKFEEEPFGSFWLSHVMNITLEALLSDPIYGGNREECGWRSFSLTPGRPRPEKRYCGV